MASRRALITGIGGQDGSYLAELLLEQGYEVYGFDRLPLSERYENLAAVHDSIEIIQADLVDELSLVDALEHCRPHEVYNLASVSFVPASWQQPVLTAQLAAVGVASLLEAIRRSDPGTRFYQASSSEIFGEAIESPQSEQTPLNPLTPYGIAKTYGHFITRSYRYRHGLHACSGILYNHESPRRPHDFLPRKVAHSAAAISLGLEDELRLGDLDAQRDWGYAVDYVRAMWLILQADRADDYIIATGELRSVRDLVESAFSYVNLDWSEHVEIDESLVRGKAELHNLVGDASKARRELDWKPSVSFEGLVHLLVDAELARLRAAPSSERP
jgi:GDPmannose 4,6-dehydratase